MARDSSLLLLLGITSVFVNAASHTQLCKSSDWYCDDGTCIQNQLKCDGAVDCPDGSDETFLLCRTAESSSYASYIHKMQNSRSFITPPKPPFGCKGFRCAYGGCIPYAKTPLQFSQTCNGVSDCADNSDELLLECRNETTLQICEATFLVEDYPIKYAKTVEECQLIDRTCKNGQVLPADDLKCDGKVDCVDGSDETLETCATDRHDCNRYVAFGSKFRCQYGACIEQSKVCNGVPDCADGSDELVLLCNNNILDNSEWYCNDGTVISSYKKCNGAVDCPDGSDETFRLCRNNSCALGFRCVYGGCVKNSDICNGVKDCMDGSDEQLLKCRNELECPLLNIRGIYIPYTSPHICAEAERKCKNGQLISKFNHKCDGYVDCDDGSDETMETCAQDTRLCHLNQGFRCQYGGCIDQSKVCNEINDCADGSDELEEICDAEKCELPEYPRNGFYTAPNEPHAYPGLELDSVFLVYSCRPGYKLSHSPFSNCIKGRWSISPRCISQCVLEKHRSITYWCQADGPLLIESAKECGDLVPEGEKVFPQCHDNYHYTDGALSYRKCVNGEWDITPPKCVPKCGLVTPKGETLIIDGVVAERGEFPWHAAIYTKKPFYDQICGGSLVSSTIVISAAHCFWDDVVKVLPASNYAVALGKVYRYWNSPRDAPYVQKFDVASVKVPDRFLGAFGNFQDDIALVTLSSPVEYRPHVLPVCLTFDDDFQKTQLIQGNIGKVAGWGLTEEDGTTGSNVLKLAELPYANISRCIEEAPYEFRGFYTSDKICAGGNNSSALCRGDSGGGLVFLSQDRGVDRYFLRGIASAAPKPTGQHNCNADAPHTAFTLVSAHETFLKENNFSFD